MNRACCRTPVSEIVFSNVPGGVDKDRRAPALAGRALRGPDLSAKKATSLTRRSFDTDLP